MYYLIYSQSIPFKLTMRSNYMREQSANSEDTGSKLSRSKSKKKIAGSSRLKEKEQGWNQRFHMEQIPQYSYHNDPYGQGLKFKHRMLNKSKQKVDVGQRKRIRQISMDKNRVSNKPNLKLTEQKQKEMIIKAFSDLKKLWFSKNIPEQHTEIMTKYLSKENNPMIVFDQIKRQFSEINKEVSLIQKALVSVEIRESCISKIKEIVQRIETAIPNPVRTDLQEKVNHLRLLTIHCVQCIIQWKQHIESVSSGKNVQYKHNGINYFHKIKQDYQYMKNSKLQIHYGFAEKSDPFFLNITVQNKKLFNVSKNLVKRVKACESMIEESYKNNQNINTDSKQVEIKSQKLIKPKPLIPPSIKQIQNIQELESPKKEAGLAKVLVEYSQFPEYFKTLCDKSPIQPYIFGVLDFTKYQELTILSDKKSQVVIGVDRNSSQRKIFILAIQSKVDEVEVILSNLASFLWIQDQCSEIRISLLHTAGPNNVVSVNIDVEKKIKGLGFRWICVNNNQDIRTTIYSLKRPLNMKSLASQSYPLVIEHYCHFNMTKSNVKKNPTSCYMGILAVLKLICDGNDKAQQQVIQNQEFEPYLEKLNSVVEFIYPGLKAFNIQSAQDIQKVIYNGLIKPDLKVPSLMSVLNVSFKFKNSIILDDKFVKIFPDKENEIIICQSSSFPVYLLPTDEENINIFLFEVEPTFTTNQIESVFQSMGNQSSFIDEFWIPIFKQHTKYTDQLSFQNEGYISTDHRTKLQSITRRSKVRTKVIKAPFVFGLINKQLGEILESPFFSTLISKDDII